MIKEILEQLAPLDAQITALKGSGDDMDAITAHAAELAELAVEEDEILRACGPLTAEDRVFLARHPERPHIDETISALFTDFFEQRGDRQCREDPAILGGVARFHGMPVTVIGHRKGSSLEENLACNFGMPGPEGYRKALRLMKQAEKFGRPIITFIDTPGAYPGKDAEERGQGEAIARNLMEMSGLTDCRSSPSSPARVLPAVRWHWAWQTTSSCWKTPYTRCSAPRLCQHPVEGRLPQRRSLRDDEADRAGPVPGRHRGGSDPGAGGRCPARPHGAV